MKISLLQDKLEQYFKWFHQHPEPSNGEFETTARIREILQEAGIEIVETTLKSGLVARIEGSKSPVVALRCDVDALPIKEASALPYSSLKDGFMHACGHDFHMTSLLGAALLLNEEKEALKGTVKLIFQPAEETGNGAKQVLDSHILDDVSEIYGLHVEASHKSGFIGISPGATNAAVGVFSMLIKGKGAHGASPHCAHDPIIAAAQLINASQVIISRNTDPFDQAVLSFTHVEAGNTWNVIPEQAFLEGTIRAFTVEKLSCIAKRLDEFCRATEKAMEVNIDFKYLVDTIATDNDPALSVFAAKVAEDLGLTVIPTQRIMAGEDFALYQKKIPGLFWTIGVNSPEGLHNPGFIADITQLSKASLLLKALAHQSLERLSEPQPLI